MLHFRPFGMADLPSHSLEPWGLPSCTLIHQWEDCHAFTDIPRPEGACVLMPGVLCAVNHESLCQYLAPLAKAVEQVCSFYRRRGRRQGVSPILPLPSRRLLHVLL